MTSECNLVALKLVALAHQFNRPTTFNFLSSGSPEDTSVLNPCVTDEPEWAPARSHLPFPPSMRHSGAHSAARGFMLQF